MYGLQRSGVAANATRHEPPDAPELESMGFALLEHPTVMARTFRPIRSVFAD